MNFIANPAVIIPDVSFYQDDNSTPIGIDFARMKAAGAVGVIIRAGQNFWNDPDFKHNWQAAKAAGLPRGSYWFYDSRTSPEAQAVIWRELVGEDLPEIGFWTDLEESYNGTYKGERNWKKFVLAIEAFYPDSLHGIYTADWWWQRQTVTEPWFWKAHPLWVAGYGTSAAFVTLPAPWRGGEAVFWQYTASGDGERYGVESFEIDLNYFNGDVNTFRSYFRLGGEVIIQPPTEQPQGAIMARNQVTVTWSEGCRERSAPSILGTPYSILPAGSVHYSDFDEVRDQADPANPDKRWILLQSGRYVAVRYPSSSGVVRAVVTSMGATPQPSAPEYVTLHYADGHVLKYVPE